MESHFQNAIKNNKIFFWGLQHDIVYTTGLLTKPEHVLDASIKTQIARRGGSITVHNPGQLVFYTVTPLGLFRQGPEAMIRLMEASLIDTLRVHNITGFAYPPHSGVFTSEGKIAFVGLGMRHNCIYHGVCLNISNDLNAYKPIFSCGLTLPVTRMTNFHQESEFSIPGISNTLFQFVQERFQKYSPQEFRSKMTASKLESGGYANALRRGVNFYNERRFWEAHEIWEMYWRTMKASPEKTFLHGLIQLAGSYHKQFQEHNVKGAFSLQKKALDKILSVEKQAEALYDHQNFIYEQEQNLIHLQSAMLNGSSFTPVIPGILRLAQDQIKPTLAGR